MKMENKKHLDLKQAFILLRKLRESIRKQKPKEDKGVQPIMPIRGKQKDEKFTTTASKETKPIARN